MHVGRPAPVATVAAILHASSDEGDRPSGPSELPLISLNDLNPPLAKFAGITRRLRLTAYVRRRPLFVFRDAALQVERQVVTADQDSLPELLFELPHVWLNAGKIQFLWKQEV